MNGFIYKITNDINDKVYVGKTTLSSIDKRFVEHIKDSKKEHKEKRPLYAAMNKYGVEHFSVSLIEEVPLINLEEREQFWINYYNSYETGYNATLGGDGKKLIDYDKIIIEYSKGKTGKEIGKELGCSVDTVSRALSLAKINSNINAYKKFSKGIIMKDEDNNIIEIFSSRKEAAKWLNENGYTTSTDWESIGSVVGRVANGKRKNAYGFYWANL